MADAMSTITSGVWERAGAVVVDMAPIIGLFVGAGVALFLIGRVVKIARGDD